MSLNPRGLGSRILFPIECVWGMGWVWGGGGRLHATLLVTQSVVPEPTTPASPGNLLEINSQASSQTCCWMRSHMLTRCMGIKSLRRIGRIVSFPHHLDHEALAVPDICGKHVAIWRGYPWTVISSQCPIVIPEPWICLQTSLPPLEQS